MKRNRLIVVSLLASTLLASCGTENTQIKNTNDPVAVVSAEGQEYKTILGLQDLYESLKTTNGGTVAVSTLLDKIASFEYSEANLGKFSTSDKFDVRDYHTKESIQKDIQKKFEDIVEGTSYLDDDGKFDPQAYKKYIEDTYDYELEAGETSADYIADEYLRKQLGFKYDKYIEEEIKPQILKDYIYFDYIAGSSKYKGQFANQYATKLEVLKIPHESSKLNNDWNESLVSDVKKVTSGATGYQFNDNYSFVTFTANGQFVVFTSAADKLSFDVYNIEETVNEQYNPSYYTGHDATPVEALDFTKNATEISTIVSGGTKDAENSWEIKVGDAANAEYYQRIEDVLIARKLWNVDREVALAKNADNRTTKYEAMTETEKTEAKGFASTYSSSNSKSIKDGAKSSKLTIEQEKYYTECEYYNKGDLSSVLPSALSTIRGTSAKDLVSHLKTFGTDEEGNDFLLPKLNVEDPVYLDTSANNYYVCEVKAYYGYYKYVDLLDSSKPSKSVSNYQIEAYQNGYYTEWKLNDAKTRFEEVKDSKVEFKSNPEQFKDIIGLVKISAEDIITSSIQKEAIVALFNKYGLEINDQEVYDYCKEQYPDYFGSDE